MEHAEYLYLLLRAQEVQKMARRAAEEGEEFIPADAFTPLVSGLEAQAVIRPIQPTGPEALILRLRHADDGVDRTELVRRTQHVFFPGTYTVVPSLLRERGWCEYLAYAEPVPEMPGAPRTP
jgi:hypothetical protein